MQQSVLDLTHSFIHHMSLSVFVLKTIRYSESGQRTFIVQSNSMQGLKESQLTYAKMRLMETFPVCHFKEGVKESEIM